MTTDIEQFLAGKTKSAKFENPGDRVAGTVVGEPRMVQRKDYTTGELLTHADSGRPQMQMAVTIQTELREDSEDDGKRTLFFRGQQKAALVEALKNAGSKIPQEGDWLSDTFTHTVPSTINGKPGLPQKIHAVEYRKGAGAPAAAPPSTATPAASTLPCPAGVNAAKWASMTETQQHQMYDALGLTPPRGFADEPPF